MKMKLFKSAGIGLSLMLLGSFASCQCKDDSKSLAIKIVDSEMQRYPESWQLDFQTKLKWDYCLGLELQSFLDVYDKYGDEKIFDYALAFADTMVNEDGSIKTYKLKDYNLDRVNSGKFLFRIYDKTQNPKYKKALDLLRSQLDTQPRNDDGGFWHKKIYPNQMWLDGLYMGTPFYAEYTHRYVTDPEAQAAAYDDILNQILLVAKHTYDPANGLYRHACDISRQMFWADPVTGQSKHCWGRALGWYAMAIVDDLEFIPAEQPRRDEAVAIFNNIAEQLKKYQDAETGLWYQVIDRSGDEGNYVESSCSAMFIYSLLKGVRLGLIDPSYLEVAQKGYQGYLKHFIEKGEDGLLNITQACAVAGLGGKENRSGDYEYYINEKIRTNDPKAVGPFIMAILEMEKVEENR